MAKNFASRLKELREKAGFESQTKFAEACGVDNSTIARLERGETQPSPKTLDKLAPKLGVTLTSLMLSAGYIDPEPEQEEFPDSTILRLTKEGMNALGYKSINPKDWAQISSDYIRVPVLGAINAGYSLAEQEPIGHEVISRTSIYNEEYFYLKVTGDSMVDAGIKDGHRVLVRHQNFVEEGKIAVVIINGDDGTLYRVYHQDSQVILQSENADKKYPPRIINAEDVLIQGQVCRVEFDV